MAGVRRDIVRGMHDIPDPGARPAPPTLLRRIQAHAARDPSGIALRFPSDDRSLDWRALWTRVRGETRRLIDAGVAPGDGLLIVHRATLDQVVSLLAGIGAGALPTIMSYPSPRQSPARFMATLEPLVKAFAPRWGSVAAPWRGLVEPLGPTLLGPPVESTAEQPDDPGPLPAVERPHGLFVQFSSGTTGLRKGVVITDAMLAHQMAAYGARLGVRADDVIVSWLPLYHDMGLVAALLFGLWHGLEATHIDPFDWLAAPDGWLRAIAARRGTLSHIPNFGLSFLADRVDVGALAAEGVDLSSLRALVNCSEPVRAGSMQRFAEAFAPLGLRREALQASFAMAECTFAVTQTVIGRAPRIDRIDPAAFTQAHRAVPSDAGGLPVVSCGPPIDDIAVTVVDGDGAPLPERAVGEIVIGGPSVVAGYLALADAEAHGAAFADGRFATGDLGYLADGELFVTGRVKDLIICRGHNVYPDDVEATLGELAGLKAGRIVVFGVDDPAQGTERLVALAEPRGEAPASLQLDARARVLDGHGVALDTLVVVPRDTLLKSTSGKLSRAANRRLYLERYAEPEPEPPGDAAAPPRLDYYVLDAAVDVAVDGDTVHLTHPRGARLDIAQRFYHLAHHFKIPRTLDSYRHKARRARVVEQLQPLLDGAFLVSAGFRSVFGEDDWYAYLPAPRSAHLVIQFRGGAYDLVAGVPPREFARATGVDAHNLLVLRDLRARFYVDGVSPEVDDFAALMQWLRGFIAAAKAGGSVRHVHTLGTSMGAYAALRAAHALKAETAWAFGPAQPKPGLGPPIAEAMPAPNGASDYHLWYCAEYADDKATAESLADHRGVALHPIAGRSHWVAQLLHKRGALPRLLDPPVGPAPQAASTGGGAPVTIERIVELLRRAIPRAPVEITADTPLAGLLDSFASTHLLALMQQTFGAHIDPARITDADLASARAIVARLQRGPLGRG